MIRLILTLGIFLLSAVFKLASKLRLTIPALYMLAAAVSTLFSDWVGQHEQLVETILYIQLALVAFSWVITLVKKIREKLSGDFEEGDIAWQLRRARELGVPLDNIRFDSSNNLIDPRTGLPVNFSAGF